MHLSAIEQLANDVKLCFVEKLYGLLLMQFKRHQFRNCVYLFNFLSLPCALAVCPLSRWQDSTAKADKHTRTLTHVQTDEYYPEVPSVLPNQQETGVDYKSSICYSPHASFKCSLKVGKTK